jgi:hypothetical protein
MFRELITKFEQRNNLKWSTYTRTRHAAQITQNLQKKETLFSVQLNNMTLMKTRWLKELTEF